jgi:hypothetical protein
MFADQADVDIDRLLIARESCRLTFPQATPPREDPLAALEPLPSLPHDPGMRPQALPPLGTLLGFLRDRCAHARARAIAGDFLVKNPAGGCVDSVLILNTQRSF